MIKRIFGEDNGLILRLEKENVFLYPAKKSKIIVSAKNITEYDMHLFLSLGDVPALVINKKEMDVIVPAEGETCFELPIFVKGDERMFVGESILEFSVTDRVLEWTSGYEVALFTENVFKCSNKCDFSACDEMFFSHKGEIYIGEKEFVMLEVACLWEQSVIVEAQCSEKLKIFHESQCVDGKILLISGLNRICLSSGCGQKVAFKDEISEKVLCLNTINPKYYL